MPPLRPASHRAEGCIKNTLVTFSRKLYIRFISYTTSGRAEANRI